MKRTGNSKIAVVGWGRGMGHKGHMYLADAVITQAQLMKADPYFFVSKTVGKDDPILPDEKVKIYQRVFPQQATIFTPQGNLNQALTELAELGYQGVVVVVGADQKEAFQYLEKKNKEGTPVYQSFGFKKLKVISRQETRSQYAQEEGPRATPMREILLSPNASEEDKFKVWRRDMPEQLGDNEVLDLMHKAEQRMMTSNPAKKEPKKTLPKVNAISKVKSNKLKEATQLDELNLFKKKKPELEPEQQEPETSPNDYHSYFKQPTKPEEEHYRNPGEFYDKTKIDPLAIDKPDEVDEARILDPNSRVDVYYINPTTEKSQQCYKGIPFKLVDKAIGLLTQKYRYLNPEHIEVRPSGYGEYTREEVVPESVDYLEEK